MNEDELQELIMERVREILRSMGIVTYAIQADLIDPEIEELIKGEG